jgi:hypothetical protein
VTLRTADWRDNRPEYHVRVFFGLLMLLVWAIILIVVRNDRLTEPDLQWHIKTGEWMWRNHAVPVVDSFSHTHAGEPWIAKEWLSQVLLYLAYDTLSWNGLMLISLAAFGAAVGVLYWVLSRDLAPIPAALACMVGLFLAGPTYTIRPHLLTLVLLVLWTYQLFAASRRGSAPHFGWLAVIALWANLHAAFTVGLVIAVFAFLDFLERTRLRDRDALVKWIIFLGLCPMVTLLHPYGWNAILATWTVMGPNASVPFIDEWKPFDAQTHLYHHGAMLGALFLALVTGFRLGFARTALIVLLLHFYLTHIRFMFFLFPVLVIVVAPEIARQFPRVSVQSWISQQRDPLEKLMNTWFRPLALALGGAVALIFVLQATVLRTSPGPDYTIADAINYAKSNGITGNVMNHYNFGGPLILYGIPSFIDGRTDQLFLGEFVKTFALGPKTRETLASALDEYKIQWTIFPPKDRRAVLLDKMPEWRLIYSDPHAAIHIRQKDPEG